MVHGLAHSLGEFVHLYLDESWSSLIIQKFGDDHDTFVDSCNGITKFEVILFEECFLCCACVVFGLNFISVLCN